MQLHDPKTCFHPSVDCLLSFNRMEDTGRFQADIQITCVDCKVPFRFIGLPAGVDLNGASVSIDGTEGRFAVAPKGDVIAPIEGLSGFTVRRSDVTAQDIKHLEEAFSAIANLAHLAWHDPPSVKYIFQRIEAIAKDKTAQ